jgi:hypothetical protein
MAPAHRPAWPMSVACEAPVIARHILAWASLLLGAAAPAKAPYPPITLQSQQPPADTGKNIGSPYTPAPVPDSEYEVPSATGGQSGPSLRPGFFQQRKSYQGEGYTPGSTIQGEEQRRYKPLPSLNLSVPLQ